MKNLLKSIGLTCFVFIMILLAAIGLIGWSDYVTRNNLPVLVWFAPLFLYAFLLLVWSFHRHLRKREKDSL